MRVFVKAMSGKFIPIEIEGSDTVDLLKHKVLDREGIPSEKQSLVYIGQKLQNRLALNDYNIRSDSAIYMVLRLQGGGSRTGHEPTSTSSVLLEHPRESRPTPTLSEAHICSPTPCSKNLRSWLFLDFFPGTLDEQQNYVFFLHRFIAAASITLTFI